MAMTLLSIFTFMPALLGPPPVSDRSETRTASR